MKIVGVIFCLLLAGSRASADPTFKISTFDGGSEGWQPWSTADDNGDSYLSIAADGVGVYGKMITFNMDPEWTGNYFSGGVNALRLDLANMSTSDDVYLRVALGNRASPQQTGGTWWISSQPIVLAASSAWTPVELSLAEADLTIVGNLSGEIGTDSYADTFSDIRTIRILSAVLPLTAIGDEFVGEVGVDNIALVPEPSTLPLIGSGVVWLLLANRRRRERQLKAPSPHRQGQGE